MEFSVVLVLVLAVTQPYYFSFTFVQVSQISSRHILGLMFCLYFRLVNEELCLVLGSV
jgi:hypothetical protein